MGRLTPRWRRYWGLRPGELRRPVKAIVREGRPGEPRSDPRGSRFASPAPTPKHEPSAITREFPITVVADDEIPEHLRARAAETLVQLARFAPRPVLHGRVTLRLNRNPSLERPVVATAALDLSGRSVRAHAAARRPVEAIDLLAKRLRRNLEHLDERRRARRHQTGRLRQATPQQRSLTRRVDTREEHVTHADPGAASA